MSEMVWTDALGQAEAIRNGSASASECVRAYLDRIERLDRHLRAYVALDTERAIEAAREADAQVQQDGPDSLPPFHGVTISVKDVVDVAGLATTQSCKALVSNVAAADGPLVRRLRAAGFIVLGKTNVPEFCTSMTSSELNGICRNPWDPERTPGGSSGGAAAALAAGLCAIAHGTDGAGSVRVPAAFCGLVGMKPTRGLVSFGPELDNPYYGSSVDGTLSRSVRDAAAMLDVLAGAYDPQVPGARRPSQRWSEAWQADPEPLRVAVTTTAPFGEVDGECAQATIAVAEALESLGHHVETGTPDWGAILVAATGPMTVPGAAGLVGLDQVEALEPRNRPILARLAALTVVDHARWVEQTRAAALEFLRFWDDVDVLVSPTAGMLPPAVDWAPWDQTPEEHVATFSTFPNFAHPFNLSGQPALSLPLAWSAAGLPLGVQLAARRFDETTLLRVARQLEQALPWAGRRPKDVA
jgi:amidase